MLFTERHAPGPEQLGRLATFGVRAAHAVRAGARARALAVELERMRVLLAVVGQATAELSLDAIETDDQGLGRAGTARYGVVLADLARNVRVA